jgi:hypothetical protein
MPVWLIRSLADFNRSSLGGDGDWLIPPPSPPRPQTPGRHDERGIGTFNWPPAGTSTWPYTGTSHGHGHRQHQRSKAHLPTSAPFPGQPPGLVSGRLSPGTRQKGPGAPPRVSRRLSAAGIRFLGILFPPGGSALLTVGLPGSAWTLAGLPRSAHPSHGRIGRPLYPEAQRCSHDRSNPSGRRSPPLPGARPYHPGMHSISRSCLLRGVIKGSLAFARPAFPLACWPPDGTGAPWACSPGFAPRQAGPARRTPGRGTGIKHSPRAIRPASSPDLLPQAHS